MNDLPTADGDTRFMHVSVLVGGNGHHQAPVPVNYRRDMGSVGWSLTSHQPLRDLKVSLEGLGLQLLDDETQNGRSGLFGSYEGVCL